MWQGNNLLVGSQLSHSPSSRRGMQRPKGPPGARSKISDNSLNSGTPTNKSAHGTIVNEQNML